MRLLVSTLVAVAVSLLLFMFMMGLVENNQQQVELDQTLAAIEFVEPPKPEPEPEKMQTKDQEPPPAPEPEPVSEVMAIAAPTVMQAPALNLPSVNVEPTDLGVSMSATGWSSSLSGAGFDPGENSDGYIEVVPLGTRKPNIPELAWKNKIDGWVLVAFSLTPTGHTRNVRVLDSYPRGIFEEKAIKAVEDWFYDIRSLKVKGEIILTQRIELSWKDYPKNNLRLDQ